MKNQRKVRYRTSQLSCEQSVKAVFPFFLHFLCLGLGKRLREFGLLLQKSPELLLGFTHVAKAGGEGLARRLPFRFADALGNDGANSLDRRRRVALEEVALAEVDESRHRTRSHHARPRLPRVTRAR